MGIKKTTETINFKSDVKKIGNMIKNNLLKLISTYWSNIKCVAQGFNLLLFALTGSMFC